MILSLLLLLCSPRCSTVFNPQQPTARRIRPPFCSLTKSLSHVPSETAKWRGLQNVIHRGEKGRRGRENIINLLNLSR